ncbi:MAG: sugar phosphate isomerase/epimerase family protein [Terrimicrobiaceae bacterium]
MKKSISIWSFYGEHDLQGKMRLAAQSGFEGFEIDLTEDGPLNFKSTAKDFAAIRAMAAQEGVRLSGLASGLYWGANPASEDPATRERARTIINRQVECAAALGIDAILVVPGTVGVDFIPGCEVVDYETAWNRAKEFIAATLPAVERSGVHLCIENVWNKFLLSPLEMAAFIDYFGSGMVGSYFDVGNALASGYPEQWIRILGKRIRRVHFKDYRRNVGSVDGFCDLLSGDVDWKAVVGSLRTAGYEGWVTAEMIPPVPFYKHCPDVLIENSSRAMDAILAIGR